MTSGEVVTSAAADPTPATESTPKADRPNLIDVWPGVADTLMESASVRRVFGEPVVHADRTVIPMARVQTMLGFGGGTGWSTTPEGGGSGTGGGGRSKASPVGAIELNSDGVHIHASPNVIARVVIAIALVIGWNVFWLFYTIRRLREQQAADTTGA